MFEKIWSSQHKPLYVAAIFAVCVLGPIAYKQYSHSNLLFKTTEIDRSAANSPTTTYAIIANSIDTDGDGLPDWKERLYGSDIHNKDSDGDGVEDGKEIATGHDPSKPGPDDKLKFLQDPNFATSTTDIEGARREYLAKNLAIRGDQVREDVVKQLMANFHPADLQEKYSATDLNVSSQTDDESLRAYGNAFGKIIAKYSVRMHRTEEEILADAFAKKSGQALKELQYPVVTYRAFANDLKALPVPIPLVRAHLEIVNGYDVMSRGLLATQQLYSDPINGNGGYQAYQKGRITVTDGYAHVVKYFIENKISFEKSEPGAPFTWPPSTRQSTSTNQQASRIVL